MYFHYSDKDNLPLDVKFGTGTAYAVTNLYDGLTRVYEKDYTLVGNTSSSTLKAGYSYVDWSGDKSDRTTGTVRGINYTFAANGLTTHDRWYTYDNVGNILTEKVWISDDTKPLREKYTYDSKNQLVRHDSVTQNCTITYAYDAGGNITTKKTYAYTTGSLDGKTPTETINYTYGNSAWKDELTSYKGEAIEYDEIGNPELYRGWTMGWEGRQLKSAGKNGTSLSFTYDSEGVRTSKTVGGVKTSYLLNGTQILAQTTNGKTLCFFYDQQGSRVAMADGNNHFYYYIYNVQGDVIALADASTGKLAATYTYDAWGKIVKINDLDPNAVAETSIAKINPFRYRGYYYDTETSLYYLNSRYYDPDTGRFISADGQLNEGVLGYNMFAYCENNPVMRSDEDGEFWNVVVGALVGGLVSAATTAYSSYKETGRVDVAQTLISGISGAISGGVAATGLGTIVQAAVSAVSSGLGSLASDICSAKKEGKKLNLGRTVAKAGIASVTGFGCSVLGTGAGKVFTKDLQKAGEVLKVKGLNRTHIYTKAQAREMTRQGNKLINTAGGINSVVGTIFTWPYATAGSMIM